MHEALALIENGILKEGYRNDLDLSLGVALELPHISELMGLARILAATVKLQAADGDQAATIWSVPSRACAGACKICVVC